MVIPQITQIFSNEKFRFPQITQIKQGWKELAIPVFIFALLIFIFFWNEIFGQQLFIHRDLGRYFYPLREFSVKRLTGGHIPLWNPYIYCGNPHLAELQTCVFYPLSLIYCLLPFVRSFNLFIVLHFLLAGVFINLVMRQWGYSKTAGIFSGIVFMFSGYMVSVINLLASLASVIWFPIVLFFYEKYLKSKRFKDLGLLSLSLTFMFLGGEPIIVYTTVLILFFVSICRGGLSLLYYRGLILGLILFLGFIAFQFLPFLELVGHSTRMNMDYAEATMWSLPVYGLLDFFIPFLSETDYIYKNYWTRQSWLLIYYMGLFAILFSIIAIVFLIKNRKVRFLFSLLIAGLLLSIGSYSPFYILLYRFLPGFGLTRYPIKFFFLITFSIAALAGIGLDYYRKTLNLQRFTKLVLCLGTLASILYLVLELNTGAPTSEFLFVNLFNLKRQLKFFSLFSVLFFLGLKKRRQIFLNLIIFISTIDIFTANKNIYMNQKSSDFLKAPINVEFIKGEAGIFRIFVSPTASFQNTFVPERDYLTGMENLKERFVSNRMMGFGIYDANGYGSIYRKRHQDIIDLIMKQKFPDETNLLGLLNVLYIVSPKKFEAEGFKLIKEGEVANIYENLNVLPRAFLVEEAVVLKNDKEILRKLVSKEFDPQKQVILEEDYEAISYQLSAISSEFVKIIQYEPETVIIEAKVDSPKFLVLSDTYYPGWKAWINERKTHIYKADYILRAVRLEPGIYKIRFIYSPFSFKIGLIITSFTVGILIILAFRNSRARPYYNYNE